MKLDQVKKVAALARLRLTEDEERHFAEQLSAILDAVKTLESVDTSGVEPTTSAAAATDAVEGPARPDSVTNPPTPGRGPFKVPKIID